MEAPARFSHDARYPVTSNWPRLRDQLTDFIVANDLAGAMLVGHSLGGLVSLMAACKRPDLVGGLVMLDSPIVTGWRAHSVHMAKRAGLIERVGPGRDRAQAAPRVAVARGGARAFRGQVGVRALGSAHAAGLREGRLRGVRRQGRAGRAARDRDAHLQHAAAPRAGAAEEAPAALRRRLHRRHALGRDAPGRLRRARTSWPATAGAGSRARTSIRWSGPTTPPCWCSSC